MEIDDFEIFVKGKHITWQQSEFLECIRLALI